MVVSSASLATTTTTTTTTTRAAGASTLVVLMLGAMLAHGVDASASACDALTDDVDGPYWYVAETDLASFLCCAASLRSRRRRAAVATPRRHSPTRPPMRCVGSRLYAHNPPWRHRSAL